MEEDMDEPLDFEKEDKLLVTPRSNSKRKRVIGLDDLLTDFYSDQSKLVGSKCKKFTASKANDSDDEDDKTLKNEKLLIKFVDDCQKQVNEIAAEDEIPLWGQKIFGHQKTPPSLDCSELTSSELLRSLSENELSSILDLNSVLGESFLEGLLKNGWLSKLVLIRGSVEDAIASWTFYQLLFSSNEDLQVSACDFLCTVLSQNEADKPLVRLGWVPSYSQLMDALEIYGYLSDTSGNCSSVSKEANTASGCEGPPKNIFSWVKILSTCCQIRHIRSIFTTSEAEDFLVVIIRLFLDRQLQGLSFILHECMQSIINYFSDSEWDTSCGKVADSVSYRIPKDLNCLRIVECISGLSCRCRNLRSQVAFQTLVVCSGKRVTNDTALLQFLVSSMNVKDRSCDFMKLYIYLVLAENWLLSYKPVEEDDVILNMWYQYLRNCSSQITSTDLRSNASKMDHEDHSFKDYIGHGGNILQLLLTSLQKMATGKVKPIALTIRRVLQLCCSM